MKYLKRTVLLFIAVLTLTSFGVSAKTVVVSNITIPILGRAVGSGEVIKENGLGGRHALQKTGCKDNISGDERAIKGHIVRLTDSSVVSEDKELPKNQIIVFSSYTNSDGTFKSVYSSKKSFPTTATYNGVWYLNY